MRKLSQELSPRDWQNPENLDRVATYIKTQLSGQSGWQVEDQPFELSGVTYRNVIARYGPNTPEVLVVGAHYDTCDPLPGADDNASGVAGLMELARLVSITNLEPKIGLEFVAFSLEEPPYFGSENMGSAFHARLLKKQGRKVRGMISLEMIGYFSDEDGSQEYPLPALRVAYPSRGNYISVVGSLTDGTLIREVRRGIEEASTIPVETLRAPWIVGTGLSDHLSYWRQDFTGVMVTDTAFYRNKAYHQSGDTADRLDYKRMADVVDGVYGAIRRLSVHAN